MKLTIAAILFMITSLLLAGCTASVSTDASPTPAVVSQAAPAAVGDSQQPAAAPTQAFVAADVCKMPDVTGLSSTVAESTLAGAGLQPVKSFEHNEIMAADAVISQSPAGGTRLDPCRGTEVDVLISLGPVPQPTNTSAPTNTPGEPSAHRCSTFS